MPVIIGTTDQNALLQIRDTARTSGLYVLGKPRMGKSWLLINMILQDIEKERGVFFIDPHGDAIDQLITHINPAHPPFTVYNFEDEERIFCINPLAGNRSDPAVRNGIFAKTKAIFDKLWKNTFEEKPWLQLIMQNTIYVFIENMGFTLVDFPLFFRDRDFRHYLVSQMQYNAQVKDYWQKSFASKDRRDQEAQMEAAQTRCEIMFAHPAVRHFFGNTNYVSIEDIVQATRPRFVNLSTRLPYEVKKIIGTALINELVFAIQKRIPGSPLYCLYIDEFQNFVSFEDMATLITQAPKFGLSTTLAHHERFGQLEDNRGIIGATSTIANKVLFQITGKDARDFAPEFSEKPPTESRLEEVFAISQNPVRDLLNGHANASVRALVNQSIRPIKERIDILKGEIEGKKVLRMEYYDDAALSRIYERIEVERERYGLTGHRGDAFAMGREAAKRAGRETLYLEILTAEALSLEAVLRDTNKLLVAAMEGRVDTKRDMYCESVADIGERFYISRKSYKRIIELYLLLLFGDQQRRRLVPDWFVDEENLFASGVIRIEKITPGAPAPLEPPSGFLDIDPFMSYERDEVLSGIRRAIGKLNPMILSTLEAIYALGKCLTEPDNHIKTRTGQQAITERPSRTIGDMINEMTQELAELSKYTAYAKVLSGNEMVKKKITTHPLPAKTYTYSPAELRSIINSGGFSRAKVEEAIRTRQENWRPTAVDEPRLVRDKNEKGPAGPPDKPVIEPDGPPPPSRPKP